MVSLFQPTVHIIQARISCQTNPFSQEKINSYVPRFLYEESKYLVLGIDLYITRVDRDDETHTFSCHTRNQLTGDIITSSTSGKLIVQGKHRE